MPSGNEPITINELPTILDTPLPPETLTSPASKILAINPQHQAGTIGGWGIGDTQLVAGTGSSQVGMSSEQTTADDVRFWAGSETKTSAPFRVTESGAVTMTSATISGVPVTGKGTFGGDGSDGALSITSGTTTINLSNAATVVKNYTSISITGTGALAFSNPATGGTVIILKSQGAVTITSSASPAIDLRNLGLAGGAGGAVGGVDGSNGSDSDNIIDASNHFGVGGGDAGPGAGGAQITQASVLYPRLAVNINASRSLLVIPGAGGGGGEGGVNDGGAGSAGAAGGQGAGAMVIECGTAYNCTGIINLSGTAGTLAAAPAGPANGSAGGSGGGGAGGMLVVLYTTLTADSGTYTVAGGAAGGVRTGLSGTGGQGGGGGGSTEAAGTTSPARSGADGGAGGAGAAGVAIRTTNSILA